MRIAVIQPHYDDAIWSLGEHIVHWVQEMYDVAFVTVFGHAPARGEPYHEKMDVLGGEHDLVIGALALMSAHWAQIIDVRTGGQDSAVRNDEPMDEDDEHWLLARLAEALMEVNADVEVWPAGIHHPDHLWTARAREYLDSAKTQWVYEELPYWAMYPDKVPCLADRFKPMAPVRQLWHKQRLSRLYASQMDPSDELERFLWNPERLWV